MPYEFKLPDVGEGVVEGEIVKWHVKPGQEVREDDPLVEVMTDKATVMLPSPRSGRIMATNGEEGSIVKVGAVLVTFDDAQGTAQPPGLKSARNESALVPEAPMAGDSRPATFGDRALATPAVRKMAQDMGIDINRVTGTGPGGRVTRQDLESTGQPSAATAPPSAPSAQRQPRVPSGEEAVDEVPLRGLRKRIAEKMTQSKRHAPHYTYVDEIDMTELVRLRSAARDTAGGGRKLTYLPFIIKALIEGLKKFPLLNSSLDEDNGKILVKRYYNAGIGVATPDGLTVVVVRQADRKSVWELAEEIERLSEAARQNKVALEDLKGSTFTITSLGPLGGIMATPIINYPEVAIVGIHKIEQRPVVREGRIVIRDMMYMSLSFDHRVVDGAVGAEFCALVKGFLENPALMFLNA